MGNYGGKGPAREPATHADTGFSGRPGRLRINNEEIPLRITLQDIRNDGNKVDILLVYLLKGFPKKLVQIVRLDFTHVEEIVCIVFQRDSSIENVVSHPAHSSEFLSLMGAILQKVRGKGKF